MANTDSTHRSDKRDAEHFWHVIDLTTGLERGWWDDENYAYLDNDNGVGVSILWRPSFKKRKGKIL